MAGATHLTCFHIPAGQDHWLLPLYKLPAYFQTYSAVATSYERVLLAGHAAATTVHCTNVRLDYPTQL
jgi:hypothetical protein